MSRRTCGRALWIAQFLGPRYFVCGVVQTLRPPNQEDVPAVPFVITKVRWLAERRESVPRSFGREEIPPYQDDAEGMFGDERKDWEDEWAGVNGGDKAKRLG
jgi:hypothetical protein